MWTFAPKVSVVRKAYFVVVLGDAPIHIRDAEFMGVALAFHATRKRAQHLAAALAALEKQRKQG